MGRSCPLRRGAAGQAFPRGAWERGKEASLYRWSEADTDSENPGDDHNHALAALRYLIARLDERKQARQPRETRWMSLSPHSQPR